MAIRGLLVDVDGVLRVQARVVPGAPEAVARLRAAGLALRFVTDTSNKSRATLGRQLRGLGFDLAADEIASAPMAVAAYLRRRPGARILPIVTGDVLDDFDGIPIDPENATHVVIGGAEEKFTFEALNQAFRRLRAGAELLAIHKNNYWITEEGETLDAGAFIVGLEHAAGARARLFGKPAPRRFRAALRELGVPAADTMMIGDDPISDVAGAMRLGMRGALVLTGKVTRRDEPTTGWCADLVLDSIHDLPAALGL
jgi:HAD superfamily hydrolase (TIGR01458 family)